MKLLLACLVLISTSVFGQTLPGAWGVKFGVSKDSIISSLTRKTGKPPEKLNEEFGSELYYYNGLEFGRRTASIILIRFVNSKLARITVSFEEPQSTGILKSYASFKADVISKHGDPLFVYENFNVALDATDQQLDSIRAGGVSISSFWHFPRSAGRDYDKVQQSIMLTVTARLTIELVYTEERLIAPYFKKKEAKKNEDF